MSDIASPRDYLTRHCQLLTSDLDHAREAVGRLWEHHRSELKRGRRYGIRWHQTGFAGSSMSYVRSPSSIHVVCGPVTQGLRITLPEHGRLRYRIGGEEAISTPGRGVVYSPGQMIELDTEPFALLMLTLDDELARNAVQQRFGDAPSLRSWPPDFSLQTTAGSALRSLCRWTARELDRPDADIVTCEPAAAALERTLLSLFLACVDEQTPHDGSRTETVTPACLRRVEDWLTAHLTDPVGVEDMAAVAGVGVRALQLAFRRHHACTPMQWLLHRRLEAAHSALAMPEPGCTVTRVASEFGFFNHGRFAAHYREKFGRAPSETLALGRHRRS